MTIVKEFFVKKRVTIDCSNSNVQQYIDIYNGIFNIFESVYCFQDTISLDNVIVDKIFLDFDYDEEGKFFEDAKKIAKYLMDEGIMFCIRFSGRGFHIFPFTDMEDDIDYRNAIRNYVHELHKINNTSSDNAVVGDLRRLRRVLHTINPKSMLWCIPLSYECLQNKTYEEIKKYAKKDKGHKDIIYNNDCISLSQYDFLNFDYDVSIDMNDDCTAEISNDDIPPCIQSFLLNPELGYKERTDLIIYLRDMGYSYNNIVDILEEHLSPQKFNHCMTEEKQVESIMQKDMLLMRSCRTLKNFGLCPSRECKGNNLYL